MHISAALGNLPRRQFKQARIAVAFGILSFSAIFLQKLGITVGGGSIGIDAFILWGVLLWLFAYGRAVIDPKRAALFGAMVVAVVFSLLLGALQGKDLKSLPALLLFLSMYACLLFSVEVSHPLLLTCVKKFQTGMVVIACIILGQQVLQYTIGNRFWPNLDHVIPQPLLIDGYAYLRPYSWNSPYLTPNGIFFLEPSAASGFLAIAFCAEIIWFKRLRVIALFGVALIAGMAGTGPSVVVLASPLLLRKMGDKLRRLAIGIGLPLLIIGGAMGAFSHFVSRSAEISNDNSSGYARLVIPFTSTVTLASDPDYFFTGNGPGSSPKGDNQVEWPANKLIFEYGLLTAILFHVFLLVAMLRTPVSRTMSLVILVPHLFFGGGFVAHTSIMMLVMFGSLLRPAPDVPERQMGGSPIGR